MTTNLDWLTAPLEEKEEFEPTFSLPEGGGNFRVGQTGEWHLGALYTYLLQGTNLDQLGIEYDGKRSNPNSDWESYYWLPDNREKAIEAKEQINQKYDPSMVWQFTMPTASMLGWNKTDSTPQQTLGEKIQFDIPLVGWGSEKRFEFQLIMLPSIVQAMALQQKWITDVIYDYNDLPMDKGKDKQTGEDKNVQITPELEKYYFGDEGKLLLARKELWKALGEESHESYTLAKGKKFCAMSPKLSRILQIVYKPNVSAWMRVARCLDPRVAAKKNDYQNRAHVCLDFFMSEEEARKSVGDTSVNDGLPSIPKLWGNLPKADFQEQLTSFLTTKKYQGTHPKMKGKALITLDQETILKQMESMEDLSELGLDEIENPLSQVEPWLPIILNGA